MEIRMQMNGRKSPVSHSFFSAIAGVEVRA